MTNNNAVGKIPVGISSCLLGDEVRYNGGHKRSRICLNKLSAIFDYKAHCPEISIGLGVPREAIRIVDLSGDHRAVGTTTPELDVTDSLLENGRTIGQRSRDMSGYVLMPKSPSCGVYSTKVYKNDVPLIGKHAGLFVRGLLEVNPHLPVEEEGRLNDPVLRENFVAWVMTYHQWRTTVARDPTPMKLVDFHSRHKFLVMSHSQQAHRELGQLVANLGGSDFDERVQTYIEVLTKTLRKPATRKGHANTLQHILGFLKGKLDSGVSSDLDEMIDAYRQEHVNLAVPSTLLNHYVKRYGGEYVNAQAYLKPYREDLGLRNSI